MKIRLIITGLLVILLQACAIGPTYTPLAPETKNSIEKIELYHLVTQDEVDYRFPVSNATGAAGGGLLFALIDSSVNKGRAKGAIEIIEPLYNASEHIDFRPIVGEAVYESLKKNFALLNEQKTASPVMLTDPQLKSKVMKMEVGNAFLHLYTNYTLTSDFKNLEVSLTAQMYVNNPQGKSATTRSSSKRLPKPAYFNSVIYQSPLVGEGGEASVALWAADNAALLDKELRTAASGLADLLITDMQDQSNFKCLPKVSIKFNGEIAKSVNGGLIKTVGDRVYVRESRTKWLYSVLNVPSEQKPKRRQPRKPKECV